MNRLSQHQRNYVIRAKKRLGQCFLVNLSVAKKIVQASNLSPPNTVLEIGPGLGALTIPLARSVKRVIAIEKDEELFSWLSNKLYQEKITNVTLIHHDILKLNFEDLKEFFDHRIIVLGNLPFNISSPLVAKLLHHHKCIDRAVLMFQREFAERLISQPGTKSYGAITVILRYRARAKKLLRVSSGSFFPRPKVESMVLELDFKHPWPRCPVDDERLKRVVKPAFLQRRKTLINALLGAPENWEKEVILKALCSCGIDPARRAETLDMDEFISLAQLLSLTQ